nr:hypothetical protein [Acidobacteriota bacterium]
IYQFPADAEFFATAEDFKQKALPKNNAPLGENNSQREARNFQANQLRSKLTPPVTVPNKLDAAYKNYLQQKNLSDSPTSRQDFLREVRENPKTAAKYHPLFNKTAEQRKIEQQSRQIEAANRQKADFINSGYNLRFGKTPRKSAFSVGMEKEYQIARTVYQAADTEEFAQAFKSGKLSNAGRIFNAYYAKGIEDGFGKQNPLLYGDYRSDAANRNATPAQIIFKNLNPEEQAMLTSAEFQRARQNGGGNIFAPATVGYAETIKQGLDGRDATYYYSTDGLKDLADPRREVFRRVLTSAGYDETEAKTYLDNLEKQKGEVTYRWIGESKYDVNKNGMVESEEEIAFSKDAAANPVGKFVLNAKLRNEISVAGALAKGDKQKAFEIAAQSMRLEGEREFEKNKTGNLITDGFAALTLHRRMNERVDALAKETFSGTDDFRVSDNPFQAGANQSADYVEKETREWIESVPFLKSLSPENKTRIVDFRIGGFRGTAQLLASADGIVRFTPDLIRDGMVYSLKQAGMDTSAYEGVIAREKTLHANFFNAYATLNTKSLAREEYVYQVKNDLNIRTSVFDMPSFSRSVGEMLPQVAPQLALAAATGGMSLPAQVAVNASVGAAMAGGQAYARTGSRTEASKEAFWGAVNGGMIPLGNKLGIVEDVALQTGATVLQGKIRGLSDNEIIDQMLKQAGGAIAFRAGTKLNEGLAKLKGKESLSVEEAKHVYYDETVKALNEGNVKYAEALQEFAGKNGAKIEIEGGKVKVEKILTAQELGELKIRQRLDAKSARQGGVQSIFPDRVSASEAAAIKQRAELSEQLYRLRVEHSGGLPDPLLKAADVRLDVTENILKANGVTAEEIYGRGGSLTEAKQIIEKAMNSTAPLSRPSAAEIQRMIKEGVPPGKYLVRVTWDGNMQNTSAQLTRSNKAWFAPLEDVVGLLKDRKAYLDGIGFDGASVKSAKAGEYDIVVYRTEDVKASLVAGTKENLVAEVRKSNDLALQRFKNQPKEFWDKVFAVDFDMKKLKDSNVDLSKPDDYINTLSKEMQEPMRARILMFTK